MFVFSWPFFDDFFKTLLATSKFFVIYSKVLSLLLLWFTRQRVFHMQCANDETKLVAHLNVVFFYRDKYKNSFLSAEDYILYERACKCEKISMGFLFSCLHKHTENSRKLSIRSKFYIISQIAATLLHFWYADVSPKLTQVWNQRLYCIQCDAKFRIIVHAFGVARPLVRSFLILTEESNIQRN